MPELEFESPWVAQKAERADRHNIKRDAVLRAATIAFVKFGYHGTSMDKIAALLHVSKPTLYKYFKNKQELLDACHEKASSRFLPLALESEEMDATAFEKIRHYQIGSLRYFTDGFGRALALIEHTGLDTKGEKEYKRQRRKIADIFIAIIEEGIKNKEIRADVDPKLAVWALFPSFNAISTWFEPDGIYTIEEIGEQFFAIFFKGLERR